MAKDILRPSEGINVKETIGVSTIDNSYDELAEALQLKTDLVKYAIVFPTGNPDTKSASKLFPNVNVGNVIDYERFVEVKDLDKLTYQDAQKKTSIFREVTFTSLRAYLGFDEDFFIGLYQPSDTPLGTTLQDLIKLQQTYIVESKLGLIGRTSSTYELTKPNQADIMNRSVYSFGILTSPTQIAEVTTGFTNFKNRGAELHTYLDQIGISQDDVIWNSSNPEPYNFEYAQIEVSDAIIHTICHPDQIVTDNEDAYADYFKQTVDFLAQNLTANQLQNFSIRLSRSLSRERIEYLQKSGVINADNIDQYYQNIANLGLYIALLKNRGYSYKSIGGKNHHVPPDELAKPFNVNIAAYATESEQETLMDPKALAYVMNSFQKYYAELLAKSPNNKFYSHNEITKQLNEIQHYMKQVLENTDRNAPGFNETFESIKILWQSLKELRIKHTEKNTKKLSSEQYAAYYVDLSNKYLSAKAVFGPQGVIEIRSNKHGKSGMGRELAYEKERALIVEEMKKEQELYRQSSGKGRASGYIRRRNSRYIPKQES